MTMTEYSQLKKQIVYSVGASERHTQLVNSLKDIFTTDINSPRQFEQINTIGQLLRILEKRDVLSDDDVEPLKKIAHWLPNKVELLGKIQDYEKSHVKQENINYYAVKKETPDTVSPSIPSEPKHSLLRSPYSNGMSALKQQRIVETLTEEIGTYWRDLARNLKIRECTINDIESENGRLASKALKLFDFYTRHRCDPDKWFLDLCNALEKSSRKDLSISLQEIMAMNI